MLADVADELDVPIAVVWLSQSLEGPGVTAITSSGRAGIFHSMDLGVRTIAHMLHSGGAPDGEGVAARPPDPLIAAWLGRFDGLVNEDESYELLGLMGIPTVRRRSWRSVETMLPDLYHWSDYPAVLKVISSDLAHKSSVGGVRTGLLNLEQVGEAASAITGALASQAPGAVVEGFLLAEMVLGGTELIVGGYRDPVYGPMVLVGSGGAGGISEENTWVTAPLPALVDCRRFVGALPPLAARGDASIDAVAAVVQSVSELMAAYPDVAELDINPLLLAPGGNCVAADALVRIVRTAAHSTNSEVRT
jgi:succinyl-CoA synthetase beta subunit